MRKFLFTFLMPLLAWANCSAEAPACDTIPAEYLTPAANPGKITTMSYLIENDRGEEIIKEAYIYLPHGFKSGKDYDTFYLIHGGGETGAVTLGTPSAPSPLKHMLDNLIEQKKMAPIIVVAPTFYTEGAPLGGYDDSADGHVHGFQEELRKYLIPYIDAAFLSNSIYIKRDDLDASRSRRAIGGFSMGAACTWYAFLENLDLISKFVPLSGDCWILGSMGGGEYPEATAKRLGESIAAQGFTPSDFFIFAATGTDDIAYPALSPQIEAMKHQPEFHYGPDKASDNLYYIEASHGQHSWPFVTRYLYNILPFLYPSRQ